MAKTPRVFIVQDAGRNYLPASDYGELVVLFPQQHSVLSIKPTTYHLRRELKDFSDDDFLLLTGNPALIGIACCIAAEVNVGRFKVLVWDRQEMRYYVTRVDLRASTEGENRQ